MVADAPHLFFGDLAGAEVHAPINLAGIGGDDFAIPFFSNSDGKRSFATCSRAYYRNNLGFYSHVGVWVPTDFVVGTLNFTNSPDAGLCKIGVLPEAVGPIIAISLLLLIFTDLG